MKVVIDMDSITQYQIMRFCYQGWDTEGCNVSSSDPLSQYYVGAGSGNVTNSTACTDGYI